MKYRRVSLFIIISIFLLISAQFASADGGNIEILSNPSGANVYIDGTYSATTPLTVYNIPIGSHTIKLTKSGYYDVSSTVTVNSGETVSVSKTLTSTTGSISVSSNPSGANVYIDGVQYTGTTPKTVSNVPIGTHTIKLTKSGYYDVSSTVTVSSGETVSVSKTLSAESGSISVSSSPSGAKIYLDGTYEGTTPLTLNYVSIGPHTIELKKTGFIDAYGDDSRTVTVNSGLTSSVIYELLAIEPVEEPVYDIPVDMPVYEPEEPVSEEGGASLIIVGAIFLLLIFGTVGIIIKKSKNSSKKITTSMPSKIAKPIEEKQIVIPINPEHKSQSLKNIEVKSAFSYKGATILYKIKVENPTSEPIGDIKVNLYVPDVFLVSESTKSIAMLKPSESKTATFEIRPTGECGDCEVSGKVVYYDYSTKKTSEIEIPAKNLSIVCPMLHSKEISEDAWRNALSGFAKAEESTKEIDMPASTLFDITTDILQDMNLYMLEPKINDSSDLYRAVAKFYGEGVKELKYAAQIEVVGGAKKSKLILKSWAEREDALTGFYHGVLDEIEKRVQVKRYIDNTIVQHVHNYGDNIGTQVKDSLVQRSNIGTGTKKCVNCGTDANTNEKFCNECGTKFE